MYTVQHSGGELSWIRSHNMAAAISVEKLEKELFCAVCMQVLTKPKYLTSCEHTFCESCLRMVASSEGEGSSLKCPMCREKSTLPQEGVSGLKSNPLICRILDVLKTKMDSDQKECDSCGDTESPLVTYCRDCFQLICQSCTESHERMKLKYRNHRTVLLSDIHNGKVKISLEEDSEKMKEYKCAEHDWELKSYFCKTCKRRICRDCVALDHIGHDCTTMRKIFLDMQEKTKDLRDNCLQWKTKIGLKMMAVSAIECGSAVEKFQEMRESVKVARLAAISYLDEAELQLLAKVGELERAFRRNVQLSKDQVSKLTHNIDSLVSEADGILAAKDAPEFSALPDDLIKKMEELLAKEFHLTSIDDLLALKGTSIQSHHLSLTMSSYADVVLSGVWRVKFTIKLPSKSSSARVFCDTAQVFLVTKRNIYKRSLNVEGTGWNDRLLSVQNNQSIADVTISFKDKVMYISFRDNVELGIRAVQFIDINGRNGSYSSFQSLRSETPPQWSDETRMVATDCTGRIIIVENQILPSVSSTSSTSSNVPKASLSKVQGIPKAASATSIPKPITLPAHTASLSTRSTGNVVANPTSGPAVVRRKVRDANVKTSPCTSAPKKKTKSDDKLGAMAYRSARLYRHSKSTFGYNQRYNSQLKCSFEVPFGVESVSAAKTGQLAFIREDKGAIIITDEDGRVQHEIKEPGQRYLSISCIESDALYVLSSSWGSRTASLTKHSLEDGRLLEYIIDKLDADEDGVSVDKWPVISNYGNDRVIVNVGQEIRIYSREEWSVLEDYDSDDSDL